MSAGSGRAPGPIRPPIQQTTELITEAQRDPEVKMTTSPANVLSWLKVREVKPTLPKSVGAETSLTNQTDKLTFTFYPKAYIFSNHNIVCNR